MSQLYDYTTELFATQANNPGFLVLFVLCSLVLRYFEVYFQWCYQRVKGGSAVLQVVT